MTAQLAPSIVFKDWDANGFPLAFGFVATFLAGTTTPQATYVDSTQTTQNLNPVPLNNRGEANIWLDPTKGYKFKVFDQFGNQIRVVDNIIGQININTSLIPAANNTFDIGSAAFQWRTGYFGTSVLINGVPAVTYPPTAAEIAAAAANGATINPVIPSPAATGGLYVNRYGALGTGSSQTADVAAFATANALATLDQPIMVPEPPVHYTLGAFVLGNTNVGGTSAGRMIGIGKPTIKFSGVSSGVDCFTCGGASQQRQIELQNMNLDFAQTGRAGLVILGSNWLILDNVELFNSATIALWANISGGNWVEKPYIRVGIQSAGFHGAVLQLSGIGGAFANEFDVGRLEVRGVSQLLPGGNAVRVTSTASPGLGSKFSTINFLATNFDAQFTGVGGVSSTATGGSTTTLVDSSRVGGLAWTTNQWTGTPFVICGTSFGGTVISNTSNTLTFAALGSAVVTGNTYALGAAPSSNVVECDSGLCENWHFYGSGGWENTGGAPMALGYSFIATGTGIITRPWVEQPAQGGIQWGSLGLFNIAPFQSVQGNAIGGYWAFDFGNGLTTLAPLVGTFSTPQQVRNTNFWQTATYTAENYKELMVKYAYNIVGTATGGSVTTLIDTAQAWVINQWAGAQLVDTTTGIGVLVTSNTATTLTFPAIGTAVAAGHTYSLVTLPANDSDGIPMDGKMRGLATIAAASTAGNAVFPLAIKTNGTADLPHGMLLLLKYASFASGGGIISRIYDVFVYPDKATVILTQMLDASSANMLSTVTAAAANGTLTVTITTGTAYLAGGNAGGNANIFATLDRGAYF
jgi:hypothetical protein